jgi:hypothetical protein
MTAASNHLKTFEELERLVTQGHIDQLGRTAAQTAVYHQHMNDVRKVWASIDDFVLHTVFGFGYIQDATGLRRAVRPSRELPCRVVAGSSYGQLPPVRFTANKFPYNLPPGVNHDLLWSTEELDHATVCMLVNQYRPAQEWETVVWVNPPSLKSIHTVFHAHVLSRRRKT